jgi:uncharacterized protein YggE
VTIYAGPARRERRGSDVNGQPVISVRGEATLEVEPEIAVVSVIYQARDRDREKVLGRLADRNKQLTGLIKGYGEAVEKLESGSVHVRPELKDKRSGERVAGYLAQGGLLEAADTGLLTADAQPAVFRRSMAGGRASAMAAPAQPELDLAPAKQAVSAQVEARFTMTRPAPGQPGA